MGGGGTRTHYFGNASTRGSVFKTHISDVFTSSLALLSPAELKSGIAVFEERVAEMEAMHQEDLQRGEELSRQLTLAHREKAHILEQVSWGWLVA